MLWQIIDQINVVDLKCSMLLLWHIFLMLRKNRSHLDSEGFSHISPQLSFILLVI